MLIVSLIPTFYTYGNLMNEVKLYYSGNVRYNEANTWQVASNVCQCVSIACGAFMVYELVRYLIAADSVLPQKAKAVKDGKETYYVPPLDLDGGQKTGQTQNDDEDKSTENIENTEKSEKTEEKSSRK